MKIFVAVAVVSLLSVSVYGQENGKQWSAGLHIGPVFTAGNDNGFTGYQISPGIYQTNGRLMLGMAPYFGRLTDSYQGSYNNPTDQRKKTMTAYGLNFEGRYLFNENRLRPYVLLSAGFGNSKIKTERLPEFGGPYSDESWTINFGGGLGILYDINGAWLLDGSFRSDLFLTPGASASGQTVILMPTVGVLWRFNSDR